MRQFQLFLIGLLFLQSCYYPERITDGQTAFDRKQYSVAAKLLDKEYKKSAATLEKGKKAFMIGLSYTEMNRNEEAIDWYKIAYDNQYGPEALKAYAYALKQAQRYEEASTVFSQVGREIGDPFTYKKEAEICAQAAEWLAEADSSEYEISAVPVNSPRSDYAPAVWNNKYLVFSSDRSTASGKEEYKWFGQNFSDLFQAELGSGSVSDFDDNINSAYNEGSVSFTQDGTRVYFSRCGSDNKKGVNDYCRLYYSIKNNTGWSAPRTVGFTQEEYNYMHPYWDDSTNRLYFTCDDPRGFGQFDLYFSEKSDDGWSQPQNLGSKVNTEGSENFPFVQGDTLYFSSNGHAGMGGLDIFRATWDSRKWNFVENLKAPLNSGADDFSYYLHTTETLEGNYLQSGYLSSNRPGGAGQDDIYAYTRTVIPPPPVDTIEKIPVAMKLLLEGTVLGKIYADPNNPNSGITGREPLSEAKVEVVFSGEKLMLSTNNDGQFFMELEVGESYEFLASKGEYLNNTASLNTDDVVLSEDNPVQVLQVVITLDRLFKNVEIVLPDIYYDFDKWNIRPDAEPTLQELAKILANNPQINIQLASHTDCRGLDTYNQTLSQKRAESAVSYLSGLGISQDRLKALGAGESSPANDCVCQRCSEEEHQQNRRTTFQILE